MNPTHRWARNIHVYVSMIALLLTLFFGITGITLNHPTWTFGDDTNRTEATGSLGFPTTTSAGDIDYLTISEFARSELGFTGEIDNYGETAGQASIVYKKPGYSATIAIDVAAGTYQSIVEQQGWVAVLNDLHKGRDAASVWRWVIDISAGFLVAISITGLVMQFYLRKRRTSALATAAIGAVISIVLVWITLS